MQLTIEVLPAPLGPMMENSSPASTPKLTSVSARTPPKRSDTPRTSKACSTHSLLRALRALLGCTLFHPTENVNGCGCHSSRQPGSTDFLHQAAMLWVAPLVVR